MLNVSIFCDLLPICILFFQWPQKWLRTIRSLPVLIRTGNSVLMICESKFGSERNIFGSTTLTDPWRYGSDRIGSTRVHCSTFPDIVHRCRACGAARWSSRERSTRSATCRRRWTSLTPRWRSSPTSRRSPRSSSRRRWNPYRCVWLRF